MTMTFTAEIKARAFDLRTLPGIDENGRLDACAFFKTIML